MTAPRPTRRCPYCGRELSSERPDAPRSRDRTTDPLDALSTGPLVRLLAASAALGVLALVLLWHHGDGGAVFAAVLVAVLIGYLWYRRRTRPAGTRYYGPPHER